MDNNEYRVSIIMWSSSSSETPKGILHSQKNLLNLYFGHNFKAKDNHYFSINVSYCKLYIKPYPRHSWRNYLQHYEREMFLMRDLLKVAEKIQPEHIFCGVSQYIQVSNTKTNGYNLNGVKVLLLWEVQYLQDALKKFLVCLVPRQLW